MNIVQLRYFIAVADRRSLTKAAESLRVSQEGQITDRFTKSRWRVKASDEDTAHYAVPVVDVFQSATKQYSSITADPEVMGGAPCVRNTRIPVYMIRDAIEYYGNLEGALRSYPSITLQQVRDVIGFAKLVVECPIEDKPTSPA